MTDDMVRVALVEDDDDLRASTAQLLSLAGFAVDAFASAQPALAAIDAHYPGIVVADVRMPQMSGIELFRLLHGRDPTLPVILITGHGDVAMAVDMVKAGVWDFLSKPFDPAALVAATSRAATARGLALENRALRQAADADRGAALVGKSLAMDRLRQMIPALADADMDLLIEGETGTGKELFARLIHRAGKRARHRFLAVACAAMPDALLDGGLFATIGEGSVSAASRGTLFLDDIDQASRALQARLTGLVEDRAVRRSGIRDAVPIDLRVIATAGEETHRAPDAIPPALLYRIAAVRVRIPPLRERREDVPLLFAHLATTAAARHRLPMPQLAQTGRAYLAAHDWPGNVRELSHFAERFVLGLDGPVSEPLASSFEPLPARLAAFESAAIVEAMAASGGEVGEAIARLGIPRKTFYYRVQRLGIDLRKLRLETSGSRR
ncbi:sigma-54-dependent transcriptional regulator [Sphingomonas sp. GB1N7]|uniref:sigma-54-dependent transcriptional regulator n=1 Tax=Parasphingomonas caseinilytica TaxID=3096158 RepID=UPI002FC5BCC0